MKTLILFALSTIMSLSFCSETGNIKNCKSNKYITLEKKTEYVHVTCENKSLCSESSACMDLPQDLNLYYKNELYAHVSAKSKSKIHYEWTKDFTKKFLVIAKKNGFVIKEK
ncbi:hypothetical protein N9Y17_03990 [Gammaproteobacteria bacterium]|nr:hypothetical protein [Gammaproteobacteria bacterium]